MNKCCATCKESKPILDFTKDKNRIDGRYPVCKSCRKKLYEKNRGRIITAARLWRKNNPEKYNEQCRRWKKQNPRKIRNDALKRLYGITIDDYEFMSKKNNGKCYICNNISDKLCVDHNHKTGNVRGLLCNGCNVILGHANDSIELLSNAIYYLKKEISNDNS